MSKGSVKRDSKSAAGVLLCNIEMRGSGGCVSASKRGNLISAYRLGSLISTLRALAFWSDVVHDRVAYVRTLQCSDAPCRGGASVEGPGDRRGVKPGVCLGWRPFVGILAVLLYVIYT